MEKRFLLAVILSFATLYLWQTLSPRPAKEASKLESVQVVAGKEVVEKSGYKKEDYPKEAMPSPLSSDNIVETKENIEGNMLKLETSSLGGNISSVYIKEYDETLPIKNVAGVFGFNDEQFVLEEKNGNNIIYRYENNDYLVRRIITLSKDDYSVQIDVNIEGKSKTSNLKETVINAYSIDMSSLDINSSKNGSDVSKKRDRALNEYVVNSSKGMVRKNNAYKFNPKDRRVENDGVDWVGFRSRYYCAIIKPMFKTQGYSLNPVDNKKLDVEITPVVDKKSGLQEASYSFIVYFGPEKLEILKKYELSFEKIRKYYRFGLFDTIAKFIHSVMELVHKIVPNWGASILIISIIIYFSMYPLTKRSMTSMKRMQAMQPKVNALKEKYKNNPQKMNEEMMKIYKENKINPLGGCLPMLLQMPVFIGLYQVLWRSVSLKGAGFLWIKDLSAPDRLFILPQSFPIIGNEINILPLIMMVVMYFQQKLSAKNMSVSDPAQIAQQKMMSKIFPVFLGYIFYKFASGLTLYFTMFYFFSTFTQWKMSKEPKVV